MNPITDEQSDIEDCWWEFGIFVLKIDGQNVDIATEYSEYRDPSSHYSLPPATEWGNRPH